MEIREYEESDAGRIEEIYNGGRMDEFSGSKGSYHLIPWAEDEHTLSEFPDSKVYVCELDGVVGFCGFKNCHINWLFVDPVERNKGVASLLLEYVIPRIKGEVTLTVNQFNLAANKLYSKFGFEIKRDFEVEFQRQILFVRTLCLKMEKHNKRLQLASSVLTHTNDQHMYCD